MGTKVDINFYTIRDNVKISLKEAMKTQSTLPLETHHRSYKKTEHDLKAPFDQAFRDILLELIEAEVPVSKLEALITISIATCRLDLITASMPVALLGDIFDLLTTDVCAQMFTYVEQHVNVWKEDLFFSSCKNILLRMCNDLLRRLSKSSATVFCGRILLFLAKFFPFSERSGLNIVSEFNLENRTEFGSENLDDDLKNMLDKDAESEKSHANKSGIVVDYNLYCKFWSLQDFFRNPNQCYDKVQWKVFCTHASNILATFHGLKLEHVEKPVDWKNFDEKNNDFEENMGYFSKYLTNQKLLDLQLYDVNFRRFVLLQFLILFQYLTSTVKFKTNAELTSDQRSFIQGTLEKVHGLLKETPPDGEHFDAIVTNILSREEHWNAWKNEGCPEFRKVLPTPTDSSSSQERKKPEKKKYLGDIIKEARLNGTYYMGNQELTKLWNLYPDNLEACKAKDRDFLPPLESYFADAIDQLESIEPGTESLLKDGNFGWRALRLLARRSPHFFTHSNKPISELHTYLDMMVRRIAADRPGTHVTEPENETNEEEDLFKQPEETAEADGEYPMQDFISFRVAVLTDAQFTSICQKLGDDWQVLAHKLGYKPDEVEYLASQNPEGNDQARSLLHLWFEEDDDSTLDNFLYILEGLNLNKAADEVRLAIEQNKKLSQEDSSNVDND